MSGWSTNWGKAAWLAVRLLTAFQLDPASFARRAQSFQKTNGRNQNEVQKMLSEHLGGNLFPRLSRRLRATVLQEALGAASSVKAAPLPLGTFWRVINFRPDE